MTSRAKINELTGKIVDAAMKVHTVCPGLLESAYEACLAYELEQRGLKVHSQVELPVLYDNIRRRLLFWRGRRTLPRIGRDTRPP
jgi:GxxExxY protein